MKYLLIILIGLGGGLVVGNALAAFIVLLDIIPRLVQISETQKYRVLYQNVFALGVITSTIIYFTDFYIELNNISIGIIGLIMGIYTGIFSSALAEVLNVVPVLSKKLKFKNELKILIYALLIGKVAGSLYYWLIFK